MNVPGGTGSCHWSAGIILVKCKTTWSPGTVDFKCQLFEGFFLFVTVWWSRKRPFSFVRSDRWKWTVFSDTYYMINTVRHPLVSHWCKNKMFFRTASTPKKHIVANVVRYKFVWTYPTMTETKLKNAHQIKTI